MSTTYQQAIIALRVTHPGNAPVDINGELCKESGRKQAIMLLEGESNPNPSKYEVFGTFAAGEEIDGIPTSVINKNACLADIYDFYADRTVLSYGVSYNELGFDFNDSIRVTSTVNGSYKEYTVTSKPVWLTATPGTTLGVINTLNLVVQRNRTDDNDRSGNIVLTQKDTEATLSVKVTQKGRLTEGTPTEYPYVNEELVLDKNSKIVQLGEQVWSRELFTELGLQGEFAETYGLKMNEARDGNFKINIGESRLQMWYREYNSSKKYFPDGIIPTVDEYHSIAGRRYNKPGWRNVRNAIYELYDESPDDSNRDRLKHHLPMKDDMLEFGGFLAAHNWDSVTNPSPWTGNPSSRSTIMKRTLDSTINGYDDVRLNYPTRWQWDRILVEGSIDDSILLNGLMDDRATLTESYYQPLYPDYLQNKEIYKIEIPYNNTDGTKDHNVTIYRADYNSGFDKHPSALYLEVHSTFKALKGTKGVHVMNMTDYHFFQGKTIMIGVDTKESFLCLDATDSVLPQTWGFDFYMGWHATNGTMSIRFNTEHMILAGTDKYAFGASMLGRHQIYNNENVGENLNELFGKNFFMPHEQRDKLPATPTEDDNTTNSNYNYTDIGRNFGSGYYFQEMENFGGFGHSIRTIRYRTLPYDIYDNGTEIIRVNNGDAIPTGYTVVPKGGLRGAWFGNPNLTRAQLILCELYAQDRFFNGNSNGGIG